MANTRPVNIQHVQAALEKSCIDTPLSILQAPAEYTLFRKVLVHGN